MSTQLLATAQLQIADFFPIANDCYVSKNENISKKKTLGFSIFRSKFEEPAVLVQNLANGDDRAIQFLIAKILQPIERLCFKNGLQQHLAGEILNDTVVLFIQKIRDGKYQLTAVPPQLYALALARFIVKNYSNKEKRQRISETDLEIAAEFSGEVHDFFDRKENAEFIQSLLDQLPEKARLVIKLRYFDQYSDEEVIELGLSPYSTVNSLKMRRSEALQKLRELASKLRY